MWQKQSRAILRVRMIIGCVRLTQAFLFSILSQKYSIVSEIIKNIFLLMVASTWMGLTPPKIDQQLRWRNTPINLAFYSLRMSSNILSTLFLSKDMYISRLRPFLACPVSIGMTVLGNSWQKLSKNDKMSDSLVWMGPCSYFRVLRVSLTWVKGNLKTAASKISFDYCLSRSRRLDVSFILYLFLRAKVSLKGKMYRDLICLILKFKKDSPSRRPYDSSFTLVFWLMDFFSSILESFFRDIFFKSKIFSISFETVWLSASLS